MHIDKNLISLTRNNEFCGKNMKKKKIFISIAPNNKNFEQSHTGDFDYTQTIFDSYKELKIHDIDFIQNTHDEKEFFSYIENHTPKDTQPVLHLIVNVPNIGTLIEPQSLQTFRKNGQVIVTAVEFAKYPEVLAWQMLNYLQVADTVIFLDEYDRLKAMELAQSKQIDLPSSRVIHVPATVPVCSVPIAQRGNNIISFGMIRQGKGIQHLIKLGSLIKESKDPKVNTKKILVVGSVGKVQEQRNDKTFSRLMSQVYPDHISQIENKSIPALIELLEIFKQQEIKTALPIEIHVKVPNDKLGNLFARCLYCYLPAYRGATFRNTSISTSLHDFVTYVHEGLITPNSLRPGGKYAQALVLIPYKKSEEFYAYSAERVLEDIINRENNPSLNAKTRKHAAILCQTELSTQQIAKKYAAAYDFSDPSDELKSIKLPKQTIPATRLKEIEENFKETKNLRSLIALQKITKRTLSIQKTEEKTRSDWGQDRAINIYKKSKQNLAAVKNRLRQGTLLPKAEKEILQKEKKHETDLLTPEECKLFIFLIKQSYIIHHSTSERNLEQILMSEQPALLDRQEAKRQGMSLQTRTPQFGGADDNIYFGFEAKSLVPRTLPNFIRNLFDPETQGKERYGTVIVNFTELSQQDPKAMQDLWSSGHFCAFSKSLCKR